jgi:hypothetical protein
VCASPTRDSSSARTDAGGAGYEDVTFSVALNTVDFVGNENVAPHGLQPTALPIIYARC